MNSQIRRFESSFRSILLFAILILLVFTSCWHRKNDWTQLTSFRVYDDGTLSLNKDVSVYSDHDLSEMHSMEIDLSEAIKILSKASPLRDDLYLWKGHYFATATFEGGQKHNILISRYGAFFRDLTTGQYYEFKDNAGQDWDKFWGNTREY